MFCDCPSTRPSSRLRLVARPKNDAARWRSAIAAQSARVAQLDGRTGPAVHDTVTATARQQEGKVQ